MMNLSLRERNMVMDLILEKIKFLKENDHLYYRNLEYKQLVELHSYFAIEQTVDYISSMYKNKTLTDE